MTEECLKNIRSCCHDQLGATVSEDLNDELLLCFLRARKFDVYRAVQLLQNYLKMKNNHADLMSNLQLPSLQKCLNLQLQSVCKSRDRDGRRIFVFRAGRWDPNTCSLDEIFRCNVFCLQRLVSETETQDKGIVAIVDMNNFGFHQARHFTPCQAKKVADLIRDSFPIRFHGIHLINESWVFNVVLSAIWPFLSEKIQKRIACHGHSLASLHRHVDINCLPEDYGGLQDPLDHSSWVDVISRKNVFECLN